MKWASLLLSFPMEAVARGGYHHSTPAGNVISGGMWFLLIGGMFWGWRGAGYGFLLFLIFLLLT